MRIVQASIFFALFQIAAACAERDYEPMSFTVEGSEFVASGVIDGSTLGRFEDVSEAHPDVSVLVLRQVDGSADDVANLVFSRRVRESGFTTIVPSDGLVASGGTDLFLAGSTRILESGACVGVHSWSGGDVEGSDLPAMIRSMQSTSATIKRWELIPNSIGSPLRLLPLRTCIG